MDLLFDVFKSYGPAVALVCYLLWRDWRREIRDATRETALALRLRQVEDRASDVLLPAVVQAAAAYTRQAAILSELVSAVRACAHHATVSRNRPGG